MLNLDLILKLKAKLFLVFSLQIWRRLDDRFFFFRKWTWISIYKFIRDIFSYFLWKFALIFYFPSNKISLFKLQTITLVYNLYSINREWNQFDKNKFFDQTIFNKISSTSIYFIFSIIYDESWLPGCYAI